MLPNQSRAQTINIRQFKNNRIIFEDVVSDGRKLEGSLRSLKGGFTYDMVNPKIQNLRHLFKDANSI